MKELGLRWRPLGYSALLVLGLTGIELAGHDWSEGRLAVPDGPLGESRAPRSPSSRASYSAQLRLRPAPAGRRSAKAGPRQRDRRLVAVGWTSLALTITVPILGAMLANSCELDAVRGCKCATSRRARPALPVLVFATSCSVGWGFRGETGGFTIGQRNSIRDRRAPVAPEGLRVELHAWRSLAALVLCADGIIASACSTRAGSNPSSASSSRERSSST